MMWWCASVRFLPFNDLFEWIKARKLKAVVFTINVTLGKVVQEVWDVAKSNFNG